MKNSRLIKILKSFSKEEMKEFEKFLRSPLFNCPKFVLKLFLILKKLYPEFKEKNISGGGVFEKLYNGRKYNELLMRRMVSDLIRQSEEFLKYKNFKANDHHQNICLLNELSKRNLESVFSLKYNNIIKNSDNVDVSDSYKLLELFQVHSEMKNFRTHLRDDLMNESYKDSMDTLTVLFIRSLFSYISHTITFPGETRNKSELAVSFYKYFNKSGFISEADKFNEKYSIFLKMINYCIMIIENNNDRSSYADLKELISKNENRFSSHERLSCYAIQLRFCNHQNLKYNNIYINESFEIQKTILREKLFLEYSKFLQLSFCRNYIVKCRILGKSVEIKKFLRDFNEYFSPDYSDDLKNYCKAFLKFDEGDFGKSLSFISKCDFESAVFRKDLKVLKVKIFYELNYQESLFSEVDSFRHFISSNKTINSEIKNKAKNFIKYTTALVKLRDIRSENSLDDFRSKIAKENKTNEKKWLLEKINELV